MAAVLRRSDIELLKFVFDTDPVEVAGKLSEGQAFEVSLLALLSVDQTKLKDAIAKYHVKNDWYRLDVKQFASIWAQLLPSAAEEPNKKPSAAEEPSAASAPPAEQHTELTTEEVSSETSRNELPQCLSFCSTTDAPLAKTLRQALYAKLGFEAAQPVIGRLRYRTTKQSGKMNRIFCFGGEPVILNN